MTTGNRIGKYRLVRTIGSGAMGVVWAAINTDTDREVALKLVREPSLELRQRMFREARAIGRIGHPNIVQILDRGVTESGEPFLVMELLQGQTLADRLERERTLRQDIAAKIALSVARALRAAHEKLIFHRDLKPANIFLHREPDAEGEVVKILDFGVSKLQVDDEGVATLSGVVVGSPSYMSPEQVRGLEVDGRTDIWALGVVLFEMLGGTRPFRGPSRTVIQGQILSTPAPRLDVVARHVSPALADLVAACLERDAWKRVPDAATLAQRLHPFATLGYTGPVDGTAPLVSPTYLLDASAKTTAPPGPTVTAPPPGRAEAHNSPVEPANRADVAKQRPSVERRPATAIIGYWAAIGFGLISVVLFGVAWIGGFGQNIGAAAVGLFSSLLGVVALVVSRSASRHGTQDGGSSDPIVLSREDPPEHQTSFPSLRPPENEADNPPVAADDSSPDPLASLVLASVAPSAVIGLPMAPAEPFDSLESVVVSQSSPDRPASQASSTDANVRTLVIHPRSTAESTELLPPPPEEKEAPGLPFTRPKALDSPLRELPLTTPSLDVNISSLVPAPQPESISVLAMPQTARLHLPPELKAYLEQCGIRVIRSDGALSYLDVSPLSAIASFRIAAIVLEDGKGHSPTGTMSTLAFEASASSLYRLEGTAKEPWHVLAVFRSKPAVGVYRAWRDLGVSRHVHVLAFSPRILRDVVDVGGAEEHLTRAIRRSRSDPFDVRDTVEDDLQFFGSGDMLLDMLREVSRGGAGFGVFGLDRWGTSSLLRRMRFELQDQPFVYLDLITMQEISIQALLRAIHVRLIEAVDSGADPRATPPLDGLVELEDGLRNIVLSRPFTAAAFPVIVLDHIDELTRRPRGDADLHNVARLLYRMSAGEIGRGRAVVVVAGQNDAILAHRQFVVDGMEMVNPLWQKLKPYYTPSFTRGEFADFFARLGGMVGMSLSSEGADEGYHLTGGHKYLSRRLGSKLLGQSRQPGALEIDANDVRNAVDPLLVELDEYLGPLFERLSRNAQEIVCQLAEGQQVSLRGNSGALSFLEKYGLILREGSSYRLSMQIVAEWVTRCRGPVPTPTRASSKPRSTRPVGPSSLREDPLIAPSRATMAESEPPPKGRDKAIRAAEGASVAEELLPGSDGSRGGDTPLSDMPIETSIAPIEIFISYSHVDNVFRQELEGHLSILRRLDMVAVWHDARLGPGMEWHEAIRERLERADIVVLLVSKDFLASDYCYSREMEQAMLRHRQRQAVVIPVLIRACDWAPAPFAGLQALPEGAKPISSWTNQDEAYAQVASAIRNSVEGLRRARAG